MERVRDGGVERWESGPLGTIEGTSEYRCYISMETVIIIESSVSDRGRGIKKMTTILCHENN